MRPESAPISGKAILHIGAPKSGTTYLQGVLWANQARLAEAGIDLLGRDQGQCYRAVKDLRGIPFDPSDPGPNWSGAWDRVARRAVTSDASVVVLSDEHLAAATSEQVLRAVASLEPRQVEVVYGLRSLASLLPSEWQEYVKHGSTETYPEWTRDVLATPPRGPGRWFWSVHDVIDVLDRWAVAVPSNHQHVILMPEKAAPADELWRRFARVLGVSPGAAEDLVVQANASLGVVEAEVLRRVNEAIPDDYPRWHQTGLVRDVLANRVLGPRSARDQPVLPAEMVEEVRRRGESLATGLADSEVDVIGDLASLRAAPSLGGTASFDPSDVAAASVDAVVGLLVEMAAMRDRRRESERALRAEIDSLRLAGQQVTIRKGIKSGVRRLGERNRFVGDLVAKYDARGGEHPAPG